MSGKGKRKRGSSGANIKKKNKVDTTSQTCVFSTFGVGLPGRNDSGTQVGDLERRTAQPYSGKRNAQWLRHVSNVLFAKARQHNGGEQEVQIMHINDRLIVSTNDNASIEGLLSEVQSPTAANVSLADYLSFAPGGDPRAKEMAGKLSTRMRKEKLPTGERGVADLLRGQKDTKLPDAFATVDLTRWEKDQLGRLTGDGDKDKIILLKSPAAHAEQKLIRLLVAADDEDEDLKGIRIDIMGKKRPCQGCLRALQIAKDFGFDVQFDENPGFLWKNSCDSVDALCKYLAKKKRKTRDDRSVGDYLTSLAAPATSFVSTCKYDMRDDQGANTDSDTDEDEAPEAKARRVQAEAETTWKAMEAAHAAAAAAKTGQDIVTDPNAPEPTLEEEALAAEATAKQAEAFAKAAAARLAEVQTGHRKLLSGLSEASDAASYVGAAIGKASEKLRYAREHSDTDMAQEATNEGAAAQLAEAATLAAKARVEAILVEANKMLAEVQDAADKTKTGAETAKKTAEAARKEADEAAKMDVDSTANVS
jgi:hypothetical protein